ncbi:MAG: DUF5666 domain-containing protein [Chloroflexota bacterium]
MTEPFEPAQPERPAEPAAFSKTIRAPRFLRVGIVVAAAAVVLVSAALTFGASPDPSTGGTPQPNASGGPGGRDRDFRHGGQDFGFGLGPLAPFGGPDGGVPGIAGPGPRRLGDGVGRRDISVTAVVGSNLSLKTEDGWTRTITVTGTTKLTKGGQTIALGDIEVGDTIRFQQTRGSDGSFTITAVEVVVPRVAGEVTAVTADGFTIKARNGTTWTVTVDGSTTYRMGAAAGSKADVTVGATVGVAGTQGSGNSIKALTVVVQPARAVGKVTAKTTDTITIDRLGGGSVTIHVNGSTTYRVPGDTSPSLSDIAVGSVVGAAGKQRSDGSLDATVVQAAPKGVSRWFGGKMPKDGTKNGGAGAPAGPDGSAAPASFG